MRIGRFVHRVRSRTNGIYVFELSANSRKEMPFSDVCLKKGAGILSGHLSFSPYFKPTSQHLPLALDSGHVPYVHCSWPKAEFSRLAKRSSSQTAYHSACAHLRNRWTSGFLDFDPAGISSNFFSALRCRRARPARTDNIFWLVLPYNPIWYQSGIRGALRRLAEKWQDDLAGVFRKRWCLKISWRNATRSILDVLRQL